MYFANLVRNLIETSMQNTTLCNKEFRSVCIKTEIIVASLGRLSIRRDHILEDAYDQIMKEPPRAIQRNRLEIQFTGEEGWDYCWLNIGIDQIWKPVTAKTHFANCYHYLELLGVSSESFEKSLISAKKQT